MGKKQHLITIGIDTNATLADALGTVNHLPTMSMIGDHGGWLEIEREILL